MKLWLLCFLILFLAAEGLQWLGQFPLLAPADLTQPWMLMAGLGLAIASNYPHLASRPPRQRVSPPPTPPAIPTDLPPAAPLPQMPPAPLPTVSVSGAPPSSQGKSISFEIPKPQWRRRQAKG